MYKEHSIGVVIPSYNEENHVKDTIETLPDFIDKIYVVDDGSTDKTAEVVKTLTDQRIRLFQHEVNKGPGAAVATGYKAMKMITLIVQKSELRDVSLDTAGG